MSKIEDGVYDHVADGVMTITGKDVTWKPKGGGGGSNWTLPENAECTMRYIKESRDKTKAIAVEAEDKRRRENAMKYTMDIWTLIEKLLAFKGMRTLFLHGAPGLGKTYVAYHSGRIEKGVYAVTITDETSAAELRGHFIFKGGDAVWHDGPFVRAMREGCRLVINEISNSSADVLALLFPVLESFETARLTLPSGETVTPSEGFHVIATDNRSPEQLPEALQDRFMAYVEVKQMHPDALNSISPELRAIAEQTIGDGDRFISARGWKHLQVLSDEFEMHDACRLAFGMERGHMISDALTLALAKQKEDKVVSENLVIMEEHNDDEEEAL